MSDVSVPFLSAAGAAQWIIYPKPPDTNPHGAAELPARFRRSFALGSARGPANLTLRAFNSGEVEINGQPVPIRLAPEAWKQGAVAEVGGLLKPGTNEIAVTVVNQFGPPALSLSLVTAEVNLRTDTNWVVSFAGAVSRPAALAMDAPLVRPGNDLFGRETLFESLSRVWGLLVCLAALAGVVLFGFRQLGRLHISGSDNLLRGLQDPARMALFLTLAAWAVLLVNNLPQIAPLFGFDRDGHTEYINYILEHQRLPLASDGWQMYQPPLYYLLGAGLLAILDLSASSDAGLLFLRFFSGFVGIAHVFVLFLCLRIVFVGRAALQAVGVLVGGLLPANLYLSHHATNEGLAAFFVSLAILFTLKINALGRVHVWHYAAVGVSLGLALLTKFSAVLAVPFVLGAISWNAINRSVHHGDPSSASGQGISAGDVREAARQSWLTRFLLPQGTTVLVFASLLVVCGWHYVRVWMHFGNPLIGNWDPSLPFAWWQDPGYRSASWFLGFGQTFVTPLFSSLHSFADGFYSSLWGDSLGSGSARMLFRPPWNHDLGNILVLLSAPITILILIGGVRLAVGVFRRPSPSGLLFVGLLAAFVVGMVFMALRVPSYAQVKAFYALPALVPLAVVTVSGWEWVAARAGAARAWFYWLLVVWAMTVCSTFWVRSWSPWTHIAYGVSDADHGRFESAARRFARAVELDPELPAARIGLVGAWTRMGNFQQALEQADAVLKGIEPVPTDGPTTKDRQASAAMKAEGLLQSGINLGLSRHYSEAVECLTEAVRLAPDHPVAWRQLAMFLDASGQAKRAVEVRQEALRVNPFDFQTHYRLALGYLGEGRLAATVDHYRYAIALNKNSVEALNNLAWILATSPVESLRDGREAVQWAERACLLTGRREAVLLGTLAAALAEVGRFSDAIATAEEAIRVADAAGQGETAQRNRELLLKYQAGEPYREP